MPMDPAEIERLIKKKLPDAHVTIRDLAGDGDHYAAYDRLDRLFEGKSRRAAASDGLSRRFEGRMGNELHALALQTSVPQDD